jgi:hypothetical protein
MPQQALYLYQQVNGITFSFLLDLSLMCAAKVRCNPRRIQAVACEPYPWSVWCGGRINFRSQKRKIIQRTANGVGPRFRSLDPQSESTDAAISNPQIRGRPVTFVRSAESCPKLTESIVRQERRKEAQQGHVLFIDLRKGMLRRKLPK